MQPYQSGYNYQGNINNAQAGYNQAAQQTQQRQQQLSDYRGQMTNAGQDYGHYLTGAQQMYGFNPQDLMQSQRNLANTQTTIANLPQAAQQQGNYYGTTAGATANNYAQQAGNLQALLSGQSNATNALQSILGATQNQANQQAGLGLQSQQLGEQNLEAVLANALGFQGQQQGMYTGAVGQQNNYGQYLNAKAQAAAAGLGAQAQMTQAQAQADNVRQQMLYAQQYADQQKALQSGGGQGLQTSNLSNTPGLTFLGNGGW